MESLERKIGFDIIRNITKGKCATASAVRLVEELPIMTDAEAIVKALSLTDEMRLICMFEDTFPMDGYVDMKDFLCRLEAESAMISLEELVHLQKGLQTVRRIVAFFSSSREGTYPSLQEMARPVILFPEVARRIDSIVDKFGEIRDNASPALAEIRRQIKEKEKSVAKTIAAIMRKAQADGIVDPEASVVIRDGKTLIPVNSSDKRKLAGIVTDESASGKTSFIEPIEVVAIGNAIRELHFEQQREIIRILVEFSDFLRPYLPKLKNGADFLVKIDFIRAKAQVALDMIAGMPLISQDGRMALRKARHPLLERSLKKEGKEIVPLTLNLDNQHRIILISGPNAGGKSVCLKTVGLLQYMFQWGMLVPTSEISEMLVFDSIFVDIGDNQSIENDLSTYSSHLGNMRDIIAGAGSRSLVLIDEFGSGTEPAAGGAIAEALLQRLEDLGVYGLITTHYTNLKLYAGESQGVVNGAMQFDVANISPLFSLEQGLPGNSFAFELARKIGLPEDIVKTAEEKAGSEFVDMERQLRKIARGRRALDEKLTRVKNADRTLEGLTERYEKELSEIKSLKNSILAEARAEAREIIAGANRQIEQTIREIKEAQAEKEKTKQARRKVTEMNETLATESVPDETDLMIERKMQQIVARKAREQKRREERRQRSGSEAAPAAKAADKTDNSPLKVGDKVKVKESDMVGEIVQISAKKVLLAIGAITSRMDISKVERISAQRYKNLSRSNSNASHTTTGGFSVKGMESVAEHKLNFSPTIDIRGQHLEEALATVTGFIDDAIMVGAGTVKILHGKGNGVLREEIRKYLKTMGGIRSMADEDIRFGGSGITVVELD